MTKIKFQSAPSRALSAALLASAAITSFSMQPVSAQTEGQPEAVEEIVVVARRREENLQQVPLAVSALGAQELQNRQSADLSGLQGSVPNLNLVQGRGSSASANVFIRGIGQPDALQTFDPAVGIYVDGVYFSRIQGALLSLSDVQRVEVLRGPQGTLYGKNTIAGAMNIVSRAPDKQDVKLEGGFSYGRFNEIVANGYASVPISPGVLAASLALSYNTRDGIVTDPATNKKYNDKDALTGRIIVDATPTDALQIRLSADYTRQRTALTLGRAEAPLLATQLLPTAAVVLVPAPTGEYNFTAGTSFRNNEGQKLDHWGVSATVNWDATDWLTLTSITAYRDLKPDFFIDIDATAAQLGDVKVFVDQTQFSQEFQAKLDFERVQGVFGLFYMDERISSVQQAYADSLFLLTAARLPITFLRDINDRQSTKAYAAYGQFTVGLTDALSFTAGLRYTRDEKTYTRFTSVASNQAFLVSSFRFPENLPAPFNTQGLNDAAWTAWTPSFTLDYKVTPDVMVYATASRGFKSGGFNGRANSAADLLQTVNGVRVPVTTFEPETAWNYEAGVKSSWMDGKARINAAYFITDYRNFQARVGGTDVGSFPVLNAGKLRIQGVELETTLRPVPQFTFGASLGYLKAKYREFRDTRFAGADRSGDTPPFAPEFTVRLSADYFQPVAATGGNILLGADLRHVSSQFLSVDNRRPALFEDGYTLVNAYLGWASDNGRWSIRGGVKNITNEIYKTDAQEFSNVGNIQTAYYGDPRTYSIGVSFKY
jgi:iron complex outermembrane recepter protein